MVLRTAVIFCLAAGMTVAPMLAQTRVPQRQHSATLRQPASRGYLGVGVVELTDERVKALKLKDDSGVEVKRVDDNSPASKAGLKNNDVILEVNGKPIDGIEGFQDTIGETQPGAKVSLTIWREGGRKTLSATLAARPDNLYAFDAPDSLNAPVPPLPPFPQPFGNGFPGFPVDTPMVGFYGEPLNSQLAGFFGVKDGVMVREVAPKTPAERAGLKAGDVVTKVNGTPVTTPREITGLVRMSGKKTVVFTVVRNKKEIALNVEVSADHQSQPERDVL